MKFKKSLVGAVLVLALSGGGFATMSMASTSAPGDSPVGKVGESVDGPPPAGVTVTKGELAEDTRLGKTGESVDGPPPAGVRVSKGERAGDTPVGKIGESVDGPPPAGVTVTRGELAGPAR